MLSYRTVDTFNQFQYMGRLYEIDEAVEAYAPKNTPLGLLYDMDKIICAEGEDGILRFYTADYEPIAPEHIRRK